MDPFTENILARARERQKKILEGYPGTPLRETNADRTQNITSAHSQPNLREIKKVNNRKEVVSDSSINSKVTHFSPECKENNSEGNIPNKFHRQNSKTRISSDLPGSPQPQLKTLYIQNDQLNMEIKVTSSDNVRVEVEIEERDVSDSDTGSHASDSGLREDTKNRLKRLGKIYSGGDEPNISSPLQRTEANFYKNDEEENCVKEKSQETDKKRGGLSKLAHLAETINQWEDDLHPNRQDKKPSTPKKTWKPPAPQPPTNSACSSPAKKVRAPDPPTKSPSKQGSPTKGLSTPRKEENNAVTKQVKWDQAVLDTLDTNQNTEVKTAHTTKILKSIDVKPNSIQEENENAENEPEPKKVCPKSPSKTLAKTAAIANKAAIFESSPSSKNAAKDPALLSVSERKALFEKNKGAALVPKAAFGMAIPVQQETPKSETGIVKAMVANKNLKSGNTKPALATKNIVSSNSKESSSVKSKYPAPKPPVVVQTQPKQQESPTKAAVPQAEGIASKMAALLEGKNTISQVQIESNVREQRQKEMDLLLNRFNKNKEVNKEIIHEESSEDENETNEKTAMISEKPVKIVTSNPEKRKSGGKYKAESPKVAAALEDVKRIRVSPAKIGMLYPNLSDIEVTTENETDNQTRSPTPENSSFEENVSESDDGNTSFGREIMQEVCKNQTPQKRPIYDESTASDISSVLDDMDDYLEEALAQVDNESPGPTPPKQGRHESAAAQPSNSFNYKGFHHSAVKSPKAEFKSPLKINNPRKSLENTTYVVEGDNVLPLTHSVSFYRKQQTQASKTSVRQVTRQPLIEENLEQSSEEYEMVQMKIKELQNEVNKQQMIISQTSQALNLCNCTPEFSGSTEQVEAERVLLVATHRRQAALHELQRLKVEGTIRPQGEHAQNLPLEKGSLTIKKIVLPLKQKYVTALAAAGGKGHHVVCLIKCGEQVVPTKLISTVVNSKDQDVELEIPGTITLNNIYSDFTVTFEVYCLQAQEEFLPHEVKYHINSKKSSNKMTPKKSKQDSRLVMPVKESPAGPQAVRSPSFALNGYVVFSVQAVCKRNWTLNNTPPMSPLEGSVDMRISCELAVSVEHRGFLTMFEDVSGFGAWHRRWCLLKGNTLSYWKYPDDERKMAPIDTIDLKNCITEKVGPVSREICARLHTFLLERERSAYPQDKDTLVMVLKGDKTVIRHLLSADTKEERIEWCNKFNSALTALRMWGNHQQ